MRVLLLFLSVIGVASLVAVAPGVVLAHEDREVGEFELEVGFYSEPAFEAQPNGAFIKITKPAVDIMDHGAIFGSGTVDPGNNFEFVFGHELEDLVVPFHDHLTGNGGTITVTHDGAVSGMAMVEFDGEFSPSELSVQPGTTVMFMNMTSDTTMTVLSGLHDTGDGHTHEDGAGMMAGEAMLGVSATLQVEVTHTPTGTQKVMELRPLVNDPGAYIADFVPTAPGAYEFRFFGEIDGEPFDETFASGPNTFDEVIPSRSVQFPIELRETRELQSALEGVQAELAATGKSADDADSSASTAMTVGILGLIAGIAGLGIGSYGLIAARRKG